MNKITTIFFDVDNTLINHSKAQGKGIEAVRNKYFPQISKQAFETIWMEIQEQFWAPYMRGEITYIEQRTQRIILVWSIFGQTITEKKIAEVLDLQMKEYQNSWEAFPHVLDILQLLSKKNYNLGVISNGNKEQQSNKLQKIDALKYINQELFFVSEEVGFSKPDLQIFLLAQKKAKVVEENIVFIGDDPRLDIMPAKQLGWNAFLIDHFHQYTDKKPLVSFAEVRDIFA